ncbi:hypothetical protein Droror1_Dr00009310 [Drosera rotundifolia]
MHTDQEIEFGAQHEKSDNVADNCMMELAYRDSQLVTSHPPWSRGTCLNLGGLEKQSMNSVHPYISSYSMSHSLDFAFHAPDWFASLPQDGYEQGLGSPYPKVANSNPVCHSKASNAGGFSLGSHVFSTERSPLHAGQSPSYICSGREHIQNVNNKLLPGFASSDGRSCSYQLDGNQYVKICHRLGNPYFGNWSNSYQEEKHTLRPPEIAAPSPGASSGVSLSSKTRIRWTPDLHEKFVECVNRLGGSNKATPKAIQKLMNSNDLTVFHIKSHLQKYRIAKFIPESAEGKYERRNGLNHVTQLDAKAGAQLVEALQLQLDVQRHLHEQLLIQRNLQLRIEEQGRQLRLMFDQQQKTRQIFFGNQTLDSSPGNVPLFGLENGNITGEESSKESDFYPS